MSIDFRFSTAGGGTLLNLLHGSKAVVLRIAAQADDVALRKTRIYGGRQHETSQPCCCSADYEIPGLAMQITQVSRRYHQGSDSQPFAYHRPFKASQSDRIASDLWTTTCRLSPCPQQSTRCAVPAPRHALTGTQERPPVKNLSEAGTTLFAENAASSPRRLDRILGVHFYTNLASTLMREEGS